MKCLKCDGDMHYVSYVGDSYFMHKCRTCGNNIKVRGTGENVLKIEHIYSKGPKGDREWCVKIVHVEKLPISKTKVGELVYIAGNLVDGKPTAVYGPHKVHNKETMELINSNGRTFYERMEVYREINVQN